MKIKAFSLIELMVVIAVVAILASLAIPSYQSYITKGIIVKSFPVFDEITRQLQIDFETTGHYPDQIMFNNIVIPNNGGDWTPVNSGNIYSIYYFGCSPYVCGDLPGALVGLNYTGLSAIPNYVDPASLPVAAGYTGAYSSLVVSIQPNSDGTWEYICNSIYPYSVNTYIPKDFLPANCQQ
jgi:prepilin-type N-terminal cleavage/methylation domain-containing protein